MHCEVLRDAVGVFFVIAESATSLLFLHRIRAVFYGEQLILACFVIIWLSIVGTSIPVPIFITVTSRLGPGTRYCDMEFHSAWPSISIMVASTVFYSLVCFSIAYRLSSNMALPGPRANQRWVKFKSFFRGDNLPALSRTLLRGGRKYYL